MLSGPKGTEEELISQCSICGRKEALFDLPGTTEKFCWGCSADFATIIVLTAEIDSATLQEFLLTICDRSFAISADGCWIDLNLRSWDND